MLQAAKALAHRIQALELEERIHLVQPGSETREAGVDFPNRFEIRRRFLQEVRQAARVLAQGSGRFLDLIRSWGFPKPRLKTLPLFRIGAEEKRTRAYQDWERLTSDYLSDRDAEVLQCSSSRMITSKGVYVCPILIETAEARMGDTISETLRPFPLRYGACHTCWVEGVSCRT